MNRSEAVLLAVLDDARQAGFIGRHADLDAELAHAREFGIVASGPDAVSGPPAMAGLDGRRVVDLGAGGGLPGLVIAQTWPGAELVLVEASATRARFLVEAVRRLGCDDRVEVAHERAETVGRDPRHRGRHDVVVARSFAAPPVTAECAAPLLVHGGVLVVSEPPDAVLAARWPLDDCAALGFAPAESVVATRRFVRLRMVGAVPDDVPRRPGIPAKRPRW